MTTIPHPSVSSGAGALTGVRVLDLTSVVMGPSATQFLADLGADVIKVEPPGGDVVRTIGPQGREHGLGPLFLGANRGKRSVVLDLKTDDGRAALLALARSADVLAYNVRPQAMERLGLGYDVLSGVNPKLLYVGMFGFSQRGRFAPRAAFDDLIQAACGLPAALAQSSGAEPRYLPFNVADRMVGVYAFGVISAALFARTRTQRGQRIDIPMFETMAAQVLADHLYGHNFVPAQGDFGYPRLLSAGRRPHKTLDGHVCCLVYTDSQWRGFLQRIGKGDLFDCDPRFATLASRTAHIDALYGLVSDEIATRTTAQLQELLAGTDIPVFPMHTFETLIEDDHLHDIGFFREVQHPVLGMLRQTAVPSEWHGTPPAPTRPVPLLGEHTADVLREVGYDDNAIAKLMAARAAPQFPAAAATPKAAGSAISETFDTHASP